jgi:hypothetical protein
MFTSVGTLSKIDWIGTCLNYKTLLVTTKDTPGIISLFETLNSRLFGGQAAPIQQSASAPDNIVSTPVDASLQSAIALLQSRHSVPLPNLSALEPGTPTMDTGAGGVSQM